MLTVAIRCIAQAVYIHYLRTGLVRIANDPYDNHFWRMTWDKQSIWNDDRQNFLHNAMPVPVHSHNDYDRSIPVHEALASGCISIEADVHLVPGDLRIGHSKAADKKQTLRTMYLEPLQRMLEAQNIDAEADQWRGIFNQSPQQTLVLLVDLKTDGPPTLTELVAELQPLRNLDYLTYWNGTDRVIRAITVVASGEATFESIKALDPSHRDVFLDAPLAQLISKDDDFESEPPIYAYNISNSYYASTRWRNGRFFPAWHNDTEWEPSTPLEKDMSLSQLDQARARGLISRYWDMPCSPPNLREIAWRVMVDLQVGVLNMDDLGAVRARAHGWGQLRQQSV